ncbi:hypothetical protein Bpfe_024336, partial [Biomphalaria pfeifferi]
FLACRMNKFFTAFLYWSILDVVAAETSETSFILAILFGTLALLLAITVIVLGVKCYQKNKEVKNYERALELKLKMKINQYLTPEQIMLQLNECTNVESSQ